MTDRMAPQPLTEADVRRIVDEQICAFLRRLDDRSRWLLQHQPSMVPADEERRLREAFGSPGEPSIDWSGRSSSTHNT